MAARPHAALAGWKPCVPHGDCFPVLNEGAALLVWKSRPAAPTSSCSEPGGHSWSLWPVLRVSAPWVSSKLYPDPLAAPGRGLRAAGTEPPAPGCRFLHLKPGARVSCDRWQGWVLVLGAGGTGRWLGEPLVCDMPGAHQICPPTPGLHCQHPIRRPGGTARTMGGILVQVPSAPWTSPPPPASGHLVLSYPSANPASQQALATVQPSSAPLLSALAAAPGTGWTEPHTGNR